MSNLYNEGFFKAADQSSYQSAKIILGLLWQEYEFRGVVDVGCGSASWLRAAAEVAALPPSSMTGIDGAYARQFHQAGDARFIYQDLESPLPALGPYDLAICVEVAEHLVPTRSMSLIRELCGLSDVIIFGAACPGQGGTGHINEQWPAYWIERFAESQYLAFDIFRAAVWRNPRVSPWYAQNTLLFVRVTHPLTMSLRESTLRSDSWMAEVVHPGILKIAGCETAGASRLLRALPRRLRAAIQSRLRRI
jgi:SAM-dependent methyltransferase